MAVVGGSHTNFDSGAFGAGAVGGALGLSGALAAGIANYRAACAATYDRFEADQLRAFLHHSELMRARDQILMGREIQRLTRENARLRKDSVVTAARRLPR